MLRRFLPATIMTAALAAHLHAQSIPITNPGFESPAIPAGTFSTTAPPPGWTAYGPLNFGGRTIGVLDPTTTTLYPAGAPQGENVGVIFLMDNFANQLQFNNQEAGMRQTLATPLASNTHYTLRVLVGNIGNDPTPPTFQFTGFPGYRIDLLAGSTVIASDTNGVLPGEGLFLETTLTATTTANHPLAGQLLAIRLVNLNAAVGIEVNFDDIRLDAQPAAVWTNLGNSKPGALGAPVLTGTGPLIAGSSNQLALVNAAASSTAYLIFGFTAINAPFMGGLLVPAPQLVLPLPTAAGGATTLPFSWPAGVPSATTLHFQFWILDPTATQGVTASNALLAVTP
jgi:hapalindole H/12-epi-hapalindole U/12-epi-fischerindole U synthase